MPENLNKDLLNASFVVDPMAWGYYNFLSKWHYIETPIVYKNESFEPI